MKYKHIVWDWNGTLFDDAHVCIDVMNGMLQRRGLAELTPERYREIFAFPVEDYYKAAGWDFSREPFAELAVEYITEYLRRAADCGLRQGAEEVLEELRERGHIQLIVSASEAAALMEQVRSCGIEGYFEAVLGLGNVFAATKDGLAREYMRAGGIAPEEVAFIGDTTHDWQVAGAIGCDCILIEGGHMSSRRLSETGCKILPALDGLLEEV